MILRSLKGDHNYYLFKRLFAFIGDIVMNSKRFLVGLAFIIGGLLLAFTFSYLGWGMIGAGFLYFLLATFP